LFEGGFEVVGDLLGDDAGGGEVGGFFEGVVFEPEDVEVDLVALGQLGVGEGLEAVGLLAVGAVLGVVAGDEIVEVAALEGAFLEGEVQVGAQVVDPELLGPGLFLGGLAVEEEDVGLDSLGVEDAGGQAQEGVDVGLLEQLAADGLARAALEEHVVGQHDGRAAVLLEDGEDVLEEVELLVAGAGPEIVAVDDERFLGLLAGLVDDGDAALLAEGRIGQDDLVFAVLAGQRVFGDDGQILLEVAADAVEQQVHGAEARDAVHQLDAEERAVLELLLLRAVKGVVLGEVIVGGEQEAAGAAGGIADGLARLRGDHVHHGGDERSRGEVLARAALHVLGVLLQEALVGVALDIGGEAGPLFLVDQVHDEAAELGRVLDLVLRLAEDDAEHARALAELLQHVAVMDLQLVAVLGQQGGPVLALGDGGGLVERRTRLLVRHFQEQEEGQLLDVIAVGQTVIPQDAAVVPEFLNECGWVGHD